MQKDRGRLLRTVSHRSTSVHQARSRTQQTPASVPIQYSGLAPPKCHHPSRSNCSGGFCPNPLPTLPLQISRNSLQSWLQAKPWIRRTGVHRLRIPNSWGTLRRTSMPIFSLPAWPQTAEDFGCHHHEHQRTLWRSLRHLPVHRDAAIGGNVSRTDFPRTATPPAAQDSQKL